MLGERLERARLAAGLSLRDVAAQTELSHTAIRKWEKNELTPSSSQLVKLSRLLGVRTEYFFRPQQVQLAEVEYRKRASAGKKLLARVHADVLDQAERWQELLALFPRSPIPSFRLPDDLPERFTTVAQFEDAAVAMRRAWNLGLNPIPDLIDTLESQGLMVIVTDADETGQVDGMAGRVGDVPFVVIGSQQPGDRQRLTLAHELGHLVLAGRITPELLAEVPGKRPEAAEELLCHRFAGAFLLPVQSLVAALGAHRTRLEPQELLLLKHEFGLSMQACVYRALDAGVISRSLHTQLFKLFSRRGWRSQEPGDPYPSERTQLFEQLVYRALAEDYIGESKAAELLKLPVAAFHRQRQLDSTRAAGQ